VIYRGAVTADGPTLDLLQDEALITRSGLEKPLKMQNCPACGKIKSNLKTRLQSTA
jgi:cobalt/nickel transport system ATP-binding protein